MSEFPTESEGLPDKPTSAATKKRQPGHKRLPSAEDLAASAHAVQMLMNDKVRLEAEVDDLRKWRDRFHETNTKFSVQTEKLNKSRAGEILGSSCFVLSGLLLGYARTAWGNAQFDGLMALITGTILLFAGILAKAVIK